MAQVSSAAKREGSAVAIKEVILDLDDIECDLDEDLDDERCSVTKTEAAAAAPGTVERRPHNVNDSFIQQRMRDFSCIKPQALAKKMH